MKETVDIFATPVLTADDDQLILLFPGNILGVSARVADPAMRQKFTEALTRAWNSSLLAFQREAWNVFTSARPPQGSGVPARFD